MNEGEMKIYRKKMKWFSTEEIGICCLTVRDFVVVVLFILGVGWFVCF